MAILSSPRSPARLHRKGEASFPGLKKYFSAREQQRLMDEDWQAGRNVCGVLFSLITAGLVMGIFIVLVIAS